MLPRWTVRLRLTLVYGGVFLASGVALLAITYVLVKHDIGDSFSVSTKSGTAAIIAESHPANVSIGFAQISGGPSGAVRALTTEHSGVGSGTVGTTGRTGTGKLGGSGGVFVQVPLPKVADKLPSPKEAGEQLTILTSVAHSDQVAELHELLFDSGIALVIMAVLSVLLGWLLAGRALRPLRVITGKAQEISSTNLHERIALHGPDDEMKRLGDTFDELLARLERAFTAQRQFVANASHELRTPLARQRTLLEVASGDPDADVTSLRDASIKAISAGEEQEQLIEALLTLASSERGLDHRASFDLADVARQVVEAKQTEATLRGLDIKTDLSGAATTGNRRLAERLVANLVENALRYNDPRGWIVVTTGVVDGNAVLRVANSGPVVPEGEIERLFEPFQRLESDRITREGHGLGLSIVRAVANAHTATVTTESRPTGGLDVRVAFPAEAPTDEKDPRADGSRTARGGVTVRAQSPSNLT